MTDPEPFTEDTGLENMRSHAEYNRYRDSILSDATDTLSHVFDWKKRIFCVCCNSYRYVILNNAIALLHIFDWKILCLLLSEIIDTLPPRAAN